MVENIVQKSRPAFPAKSTVPAAPNFYETFFISMCYQFAGLFRKEKENKAILFERVFIDLDGLAVALDQHSSRH